ncbi:hypothetical protein VTN00DRAFT_5169 [Thermoascus crustaceus]|uniref:uncharacterized protein n=1 Tax=Thermoascus crustaceus TaxID=5088 RepID=UPI003742B018
MTVTPETSVLATLPCSLPTSNIPDEIDAVAVATSFAEQLDHLDRNSFVLDAIWRDTFALTGTMRTFYTAGSIAAAWTELTHLRQAKSFTMNSRFARVTRHSLKVCWIDVGFTFETASVPETTCSGFLSLVPAPDGTWKIWAMKTILERLKGQPSVDELEPVSNLTNGVHCQANGVGSVPHFDCVVVGAGLAGLCTAGRLKALSVSYLVIERNSQVGDNWALRYDSAKLHTTREYAHLPFERTFTPDFPEFLTKDHLANAYRAWAAKYDINIWLSTNLESGSWDKTKNKWTLQLRQGDLHRTVSCSFVVMASGAACQVPLMPTYPGQKEFHGQVLHSVHYKNSIAWKGKHGIVIGSANTAHDVAEDMLEAGLASVTMVQRGKTFVLPVEYHKKSADALYNDKIPTELADRLSFSTPLAVTRAIARLRLHAQAAMDPERFDALERAGFKTERYGDIAFQINEKLGGHYMDVGASAKIAKGLIKVKSDALPVRYTKDCLEFSDGSHLKADAVVFCTGFANLRDTLRELFGTEVANGQEDFFGLNGEGEIKGAFRPCGHPNLYCIGGTIGHARYYSRFVALQIKAALLGTRLPVYEKTPVPESNVLAN